MFKIKPRTQYMIYIDQGWDMLLFSVYKTVFLVFLWPEIQLRAIIVSIKRSNLKVVWWNTGYWIQASLRLFTSEFYQNKKNVRKTPSSSSSGCQLTHVITEYLSFPFAHSWSWTRHKLLRAGRRCVPWESPGTPPDERFIHARLRVWRKQPTCVL